MTPVSYFGGPIIGGISSYSFAVKITLSGLSPSLWTFNASTANTNSLCSNWVTLPTSCVLGTIQLYHNFSYYCLASAKCNNLKKGLCGMLGSGSYKTRPYTMGVASGNSIGLVANLESGATSVCMQRQQHHPSTSTIFF